ncbi:radical SAM protein [Gammaproteobacteria bacterium]|nr:radical SAM protein [Gammaproteobacteria bacterium]MDC3279523.1 B12-binding domain-containing radical SAM protein [Gammaproteobacteria bacterium]
MIEQSSQKILYVNPCLRRNAPTKVLPVGLASVMTYMAREGYTNFDLYDIDINEYSDEEVETYVRNTEYDVILLGSIVTHYKWVKWFVRTCKSLKPETKVIVGNSVAGSIYELFLQNCPADVVVIGEGEISCLETVDAMRMGRPLAEVPGIAYRTDNGEIVKTPKRKASKMEDFPMVEWDAFDVDRYIKHSAQYMSMGIEDGTGTIAMPVSTARGCAFRCTFCHFVFWDDPYRYRSADSVIAEIRRNIENYGVNYINFWDDLSFAGIKQTERMCDAIIASGLKFNWMAAIRADLFGHPRNSLEYRIEVAQKMKDAGCVSVGFALESGSQKILDMMNKKIDASFFLDTVRILSDCGITCNTSLVFGYPIETRETIQETFDMCLAAGVYPSIGFLLPLPYTGMYDYAKEHGYIVDEDKYLDQITERQDICINMTSMSDEAIMEAIKDGAEKLSDALNMGLSRDRLIKTGGYQNKSKKKRTTVELTNERNQNDFSLSYSDANFEVDSGLDSAESR